jgi:hypothetical protein
VSSECDKRGWPCLYNQATSSTPTRKWWCEAHALPRTADAWRMGWAGLAATDEAVPSMSLGNILSLEAAWKARVESWQYVLNKMLPLSNCQRGLGSHRQNGKARHWSQIVACGRALRVGIHNVMQLTCVAFVRGGDYARNSATMNGSPKRAWKLVWSIGSRSASRKKKVAVSDRGIQQFAKATLTGSEGGESQMTAHIRMSDRSLLGHQGPLV